MVVVFDSKTGNVKRFVQKLKLPAIQIHDSLKLEEPYVLVTYTTGFGQVPERVSAFLRENHDLLLGVAASGNRNWGDKFARSADLIAEKYEVPVIGKFELSGTMGDAERFRMEVSRVAAY
ncbi:class Ib ribonucleoside-diphosphate reductase assembly flavoprotein NrdI [Gorillibacterium timonense]|uniref:class Ib ribonucleoside-diphosphate reductase assembly flavoprotein NrdI n=1 Tax=Gorillibacterium timonense TaxID=1689269 RepID=UPI00071E3451|nr:class Ib ribonucleoside-diphosphate reductase assembly flavoprotein NrdI [Gorillibacterium timonense]